MVNKIKWLILYILKYLFIITGRKWEHFYSFLLNRQERKNSFENIEKLNLSNKTKILTGNVFHEIEKSEICESKFNLIFCDPPFKNIDVGKLIKLIIEKNLLEKKGIIILHRNKSSKENFSNIFNLKEVLGF